MKKLLSYISGKGAYVTGIGLAALTGGLVSATVLAAIPSSDGTIHGCYRNSAGLLNPKGSLRVIDPSASDTCASNETSLNWNQTGPQGPAGPAGSAVGYARMDVVQTQGGLSSVTFEPAFTSNISAYSYNTAQQVLCVTVNTPQLHGAVFGAMYGSDAAALSDGQGPKNLVMGDPLFNASWCPAGTDFEQTWSQVDNSLQNDLYLLFY